ncbi:MAG: STAS domain-containing protein [Fibrobacterota bacterium]
MILSMRGLSNFKIVDVGEPTRKYEDVTAIKEKVEALLDAGENFLAINLTNVDYMHSYFIKILTATYKKLKTRNGELVLIGPNEFVRNLMRVLNLDDYIRIFATESAFKDALEQPKA